jgi:hypothetical protein
MSWQLNYPDGVRGGSNAWEDLNARTLDDGLDFGDSSEAVVEQVRQAKVMTNSIIVSGVVGDKDKEFYVNLSGHANPDHEPKEGWANDMISISISQKGD